MDLADGLFVVGSAVKTPVFFWKWARIDIFDHTGYTPSEAEWFDEGWRAAVEDNLVNANERAKYRFESIRAKANPGDLPTPNRAGVSTHELRTLEGNMLIPRNDKNSYRNMLNFLLYELFIAHCAQHHARAVGEAWGPAGCFCSPLQCFGVHGAANQGLEPGGPAPLGLPELAREVP